MRCSRLILINPLSRVSLPSFLSRPRSQRTRLPIPSSRSASEKKGGQKKTRNGARRKRERERKKRCSMRARSPRAINPAVPLAERERIALLLVSCCRRRPSVRPPLLQCVYICARTERERENATEWRAESSRARVRWTPGVGLRWSNLLCTRTRARDHICICTYTHTHTQI